jgi:oxygen-dependent protoporphyrinogen oxidase
MTETTQVDVVVIGAGLTGLTTGFYLKRRNTGFLVLEENERTGGVIRTRHQDGFMFEEGPNTGVLGNPDVAELFEDLDDCTCETAGGQVNKRYILKNGTWHAMPMGLAQAVGTPLFSVKDKFRILGEPFRKPGTNPEEPLSELVKRRMGRSFLDYAIDPFILGVYSGDPSKLITKYAFPKLYNLEQNYGSFIGGSVKKMFEKKDTRDRKATRKVFSVTGGLSALTGSLENSIRDNILLNVKQLTVIPQDGGYLITGTRDDKPLAIKARRVITTAGAHALPALLPFVPRAEWEPVMRMKYAKVIQIALGFRKWTGMDPDGFGGLIPFLEKRDILGVLFLSSLFAGRAPEGGALFAVFAGGVRREELFSLPDDVIRAMVAREFSDLMQMKEFDPQVFEIMRYTHAIPQYGAESREKLAALERIQLQYPGLMIGGNGCDGIGMADRIKQGKRLALEVAGLT